MKPKPLTAEDLFHFAIQGEQLPIERVLATFADEKNWVQLYHAESGARGYQPLPCEWAFIGPVRPPFELAQQAICERKTLS